jgi:VWFA-related protein
MDYCRSDSTIAGGRQSGAKPNARFGWRRCGFLAAGLLSCLVAGAASDPSERDQQPAPPQPTFRTEANYVRVDVYPTRDNAPVMDLRQDEFDVLENGVPQRIEQFEHVVIRAAGPQETRIEPNTVAESRSMAENPRARLFVLFLDTYHVDVAGSHNIRAPLVEALDRMIGPEDLVGVMTSEMSARDVTFARRTTTIDGFLTRYWHWGERDRMNPSDREDQEYGGCYPNSDLPTDKCKDQNGVAAEMIDRRHEKRSLDALQDLVRFLRGVREERKAILAITNGWLLFRPNPQLMRPLNCQGVPTGPPVGIDPRTGRLTTKPPDTGVPRTSTCETDRTMLAQLDDEQQFREMLDEANRANASFYPIDPRGLAVFDTPIMRLDVPGSPPPPTPLAVDRAMLTARLTALRTLAGATDGLAIVDTNDLSTGLRRVVADLSSYYLLGYYSSGRLDGRFHSITVRVKRPGVSVRARRGYLAATPAAVTSTPRASSSPSPAAVAESAAIDAALAPLGAAGREAPIRLRAASGWKRGNRAAIWIVGELGAGDEWKSGAEADVMLTSAAGATLATGHARVEPGSRSFRVALAPAEPVAPGSFTVRLRARSGSGSAPSNETVDVTLPEAPFGSGVIFVRRGAGNREMPTADLRFRRSEQLRAELPAPEGEVQARLLDRTGKPLPVPVTTATREDVDGSRWLTAQLVLAPLAAADYIVELTNGATRVLAGFRVVN